MLQIRLYTDEDFPVIQEWWTSRGIEGTTPNYISDTSFIVESRGKPILFISLILTNLKEYAYLENFTSSPTCDKQERREGSLLLSRFLGETAKNMGYNKLLTLAPNDKLKDRFKLLGFNPTVSGAHVMMKELQ